MVDELAELALAFAHTVVKPGGSAALIDPDNRIIRWVSIDEAVASGKAYMVEPREGILPLDLDTQADWEWSSRVRVGLETLGCRFVLTDSGRPGHGHLWVIAPPGWGPEYTKAQTYAVAGAHDRTTVRKDTATRPPYSPHRVEPVRSTVIEPGPATALQWFKSVHPRPLPANIADALRGLDPRHLKTNRGTPSRGITLHAVACSAVNARWSYDDFVAALRNPENLTASKYRELPPVVREDYAVKVWSDAVLHVRSNPPKPSGELARASLKRLVAAIPQLEWSPRTGSTDRSVYAALVQFGTEGATTEVSASVRQIGETANLSNNSVSRSLKRLCDARLIQRLPAPGYGYACRYRLLPLQVAAVETSVPGDNSGLLMGAQRSLLSHSTALLADVFSNGSGLGLSCRETWEALPERPTKTSELATLRPGKLRPTTIRSHLRILRDHGFADRKGHRWWRLHPDDESLRRTAEMLGVRGKSAARKAARERQVSGYRERFSITLPQPGERRDGVSRAS